MSVPTKMSHVEERLFDEYSLGSMQPSDEWQNDRKSIEECDISEYGDSFDQIDESTSIPDGSTYNMESLNFDSKHFFPNQSRFVDYLSNLVPTFSVEGSKGHNPNSSYSTATHSQVKITKPNAYSKSSASNHSRCIIENPESIQERQDEDKPFGWRRGRDEEDCTRDQSSRCSVEEISQISEITMDIPTVAHEEKFGHCSALPTISESRQFEAPIATTCAAGVVGAKVRCSAAEDTTTNKKEGNNDFIDFVFELVEDALCKPIKTSKSERKKVFMEAFQEESEKAFKLANFNGARENSRHSRCSRSSGSTKRSTSRSKSSPSPVNDRDGSIADQVETSTHSRRSRHSKTKVVDKPPLDPSRFQTEVPDEELTMDWSKMMSLAEKQLEAAEAAEGKSVISHNSQMSEASKRSEKSSVYQSVMFDGFVKGDESVVHDERHNKGKSEATGGLKSSIASSNSMSSSTHAALADEIAMDLKERSTHVRMADEVVQELRELSALDSSSFEEDSRFILTSTLFQFLGSLVPTFGSSKKQRSEYEQHEEFAFDEISETLEILSMESKEFLGADEKFESEEKALKLIRYVAFLYAFLFWPSGIARRIVPNAPLRAFNKKRVDKKPTSLLQLVSERD